MGPEIEGTQDVAHPQSTGCIGVIPGPPLLPVVGISRAGRDRLGGDVPAEVGATERQVRTVEGAGDQPLVHDFSGAIGIGRISGRNGGREEEARHVLEVANPHLETADAGRGGVGAAGQPVAERGAGDRARVATVGGVLGHDVLRRERVAGAAVRGTRSGREARVVGRIVVSEAEARRGVGRRVLGATGNRVSGDLRDPTGKAGVRRRCHGLDGVVDLHHACVIVGERSDHGELGELVAHHQIVGERWRGDHSVIALEMGHVAIGRCPEPGRSLEGLAVDDDAVGGVEVDGVDVMNQGKEVLAPGLSILTGIGGLEDTLSRSRSHPRNAQTREKHRHPSEPVNF